jgi:hypothetical protein
VGDLPVIFKDSDGNDEPVTLKTVLWAPSAISSMLSVSQAVRGGCAHGVDDDGAWLSLPPPNNEYIWAEEEQGLYILTAKLQLASPAVISLSTGANNVSTDALSKEQVEILALQIHASLGHLNWTSVKQLLKEGAISQVCELSARQKASILSLKTLVCRECDLSKKTLRSLPRTTPTPPTRHWQLVEADHCGPFSPQVGGNIYITVFIEVATGVGFIFERKTLRGHDSADLLATVDNIARRSSNGIEHFRTDEGSDWKSSEVAEVVHDRGNMH